MRRYMAPAGLLVSWAMLFARLPFTSVDLTGVVATLTFYILNPPFLVIKLLAPYREDDPKLLWWLQFEYPVAAVTALLWWAAVWLVLNRRGDAPCKRREA